MKEKYNWATGGRALSLEERKIARRLSLERIAAPHGPDQAEARFEVCATQPAVAATSKSRSVWDWWAPAEPQPNTDIG